MPGWSIFRAVVGLLVGCLASWWQVGLPDGIPAFAWMVTRAVAVWQVGWLVMAVSLSSKHVGWVPIWQVGWLACSVAGWLAGCRAGCVDGWVVGLLAGWLAGWLAA